MKHYLSLISVLILLCYSPCLAREIFDETPLETDSVIVKEYSLLAKTKGHEITGICAINISADSSIVGTVVNEFGIKAFDFSYTKGKVEIFHVMSLLNKWYIRKVLRNDFRFIISNIFICDSELSEKKRTMKKMPDGKITVVNSRHKITYTFLPLTEQK